MVETALFVVAALAALGGAVTVVLARNPIYSAVGLLGTLFSVAVLYVVQLAHLVAAVQVIVYAGAVMTLFLFVIMLIGVDKEEKRVEPLPRQRLWVGALAGVVIVFAAGVALFGDFVWVPAAATPVDPEATNGTIQAVAEPLFTDWV
ncbi:MAG TPA: NADH-quinone oxidoreductase subunit J, partial [Acidimicrobiia bacterium]|nr:NADH-quinone oxidoreductase subunit J [Acidimicrobiia bacterium]